MESERTPNFCTGDDETAARKPSGLVPSAGLLTAALAGLLAVGATGCDEDENGNPICEPPTAPPPVAPTGSALDAGVGTHMPATPAGDAGVDRVLEQTDVARSLAELSADCETRGGYMQIHAACAGANDCKGFSYQPGEPGTLTEHSCSASNGCTGASCVVGPSERAPQRTGKQVYEDEDLPKFGPASCLNCHAVWGEKLPSGEYPPPDATKFKLFLQPGSTRNAVNWLAMTAAEQEGIVAFGRTSSMPGGLTLESMKGYHKLLSRGEIKRVVEHIRSLTPVVAEIPLPK
ncbi:MAG: hypothetical protein ABW252_07895 [Polyangiales bacterium]